MALDPRPWNAKKAASAPKDYHDTIEFLEQLRPNGPWVLTAILPDGPTETITATTHEEVILFVQDNDGKRNLYFSVNPTRTALHRKASKFDIAAIEYLLADLDPRHDETPDAAKTRYIAALTSHPVGSTIIIDSGNGIQALWKLADPIQLADLITTADNKKAFSEKDAKIVADVEARSAALMTTLGSVAGTQNIDRILRLPGTTNLPNKKKLEAGRTACPTKLVRFNDLLHTLEAFPAPETHHEQQQTNGGAEQRPKVPELFKNLPAALRKAIAAAPYEGEDTSVTAASVMEQLQVRGLFDADIITLFEAYPKGIGKRYAEGKDLKADVRRIRNKFQAKTKSHKSSLVIRAADILPRAKRWLWDGHLLCGALELLSGTPGLGKSQVQINYIACTTAGLTWPDGTAATEVKNVVMLTAEDTMAEEVIPRLIVAKADVQRVHILNFIRSDNKNRQFLLQEDLEELERIVLDIGNVGLVTIDPITAYMGGKVDSHKATEVRSQLSPLKDFSERTDVAVSAITHPAKHSGPKAIDQFIGSQAFIAAGRIGHVCVEELDVDEDSGERTPTGRVLFGHAKHNPTKRRPTLAYHIEEAFAVNDHVTGQPIQAPRVVWDGEVHDMTADQAVAASNGAAPARMRSVEQNKLQNLLNVLLKDGPIPQKEVEASVEKAGFTPTQLRTAKEKLGIVSERKEDRWEWSLIM